MSTDIKTADTILEFLHIRPVRKAAQNARRFTVYSTVPGELTPLHRSILELPADSLTRDKAIVLAKQFMAGTDYVKGIPPALVECARKISANPAKAADIAKAELGKPLPQWLADKDTKALWVNLWDSLYAQILSPATMPADREDIFLGIRCMHFLTTAAADPALWQGNSWSRILRIRPLIPQTLVPPCSHELDAATVKIIDAAKTRLGEVLKEVSSLSAAADDLRQHDMLYHKNLGPQKATEAPISGNAGGGGNNAAVENPAPVGENPAGGGNTGAGGGGNAGAGNPGGVVVVVNPGATPSPEPKAAGPVNGVISTLKDTPGWLYQEDGTPHGDLLEGTKELLAARRTEFATKEATEAAAVLERDAYVVADRFFKSLAPEAVPVVTREAAFRELMKLVPLATAPGDDQPTAPAEGSPEARGIRPLGIGDLLVVKQLLWKYTPGEVAHVENVLASELKNRKHVRTVETEETITSETERTEENEKDQQSTERFELQRETQKTVENYFRVDAGFGVTASYGVVSFSAHADFALGQTSSESSKTASNFAKEVTEKTVSRISQRTREERVRRSLQRVEETNEHGFDNKSGTDHITGVYRWVDKFYKARVINRGKRLMMEFIVPEPAAFYLHALANPVNDPKRPKKPDAPSFMARALRPSDLNGNNYTSYVAQYGAEGVEAFPGEVLYISGAVAGNVGGNGDQYYSVKDTTLVVPSGYRATSISGARSWMGPSNRPYFCSVKIGGHDWDNLSIYGIEGPIVMTVAGWGGGYQVSVKVRCDLTSKGREAWQLKAYQAIMEGYQRQLAEWSDLMAAQQIEAGVQIEGRNPGLNRKLERDELRKAALRLLTNEYARTRVSGVWRTNELFNGMVSGGFNNYPELDPAESLVEGKIIQFFEQAFEWNNSTYRFLPYFWGRKRNWLKNYTLSDPDPQFADFLRAGAARLVVPVHPEYTESVLHYLHTNEIWNGGEPPTLDDPLYVSIVDEIKADNDADLAGAPVCSLDDPQYPCIVEEFDIKLPTTLVWLQQDSALPVFDLDTLPNPQLPPANPQAIADKFDAKAKELGSDVNWRTSVVDLMKVLDLPTSLQYRRKLATKLGCPQQVLNASSTQMNVWLHAELLRLAYSHGGVIPSEVTDD